MNRRPTGEDVRAWRDAYLVTGSVANVAALFERPEAVVRVKLAAMGLRDESKLEPAVEPEPEFEITLAPRPTAAQEARIRELVQERMEMARAERSAARTPRRVYTEDDVLDWWEFYAERRSVSATAEQFGVPYAVVHGRLEELGVFDEIPPRRGRPVVEGGTSEVKRQLDAMVRRIFEGRWTDAETAIADALSRIDPEQFQDTERRRVPYARSMDHVSRTRQRRAKVIQSNRERGLIGMVSARERKFVRNELGAAGLMGPQVRAQRVGRYWS